MANEVGTATNFEDLFTKIVTFLTTNSTLVTAGQQWIVNRIYRDNVASITTNMMETTIPQYRRIFDSFRYDPRSINTNNDGDSAESYTALTSVVTGTSNISLTFRVTKEVSSVRIAAPNGSGGLTSTIRNFRLQYSDNNSTWTTALTVASNPIYSINEVKTFAVSPSVGTHLYWKIIIDSKQDLQATGTVTWKSLLLLDSAGLPVNHFGNEVLFKSTGTAGTDEIFTGIRSEQDVAQGWYNLFLNGYTGFNPAEMSWLKQPGAIPGYESVTPLKIPMVPAWNSTTPYWFSASGRAFKFCLKISTSYEAGYLGFLIPYATPTQYTYPLVVGGSLIPSNTTRGPEWRYSYNSNLHSIYTIPAAEGSPSIEAETMNGSLYLRLPNGSWSAFGQRSGVTTIDTMSQSLAYPFTMSGIKRGVWPSSIRNSSNRKDYSIVLGGGYLLQPIVLHQRWPNKQVFGELDGISSISGFSNAAENTTVYSGKTHVIFNNVTRTEVHEFWSLGLEN